jgi:hypothetical protein
MVALAWVVLLLSGFLIALCGRPFVGGALVVGCFLFLFWSSEQAIKREQVRCEKAGGEFRDMGRMQTLCLKPGTVVNPITPFIRRGLETHPSGTAKST